MPQAVGAAIAGTLVKAGVGAVAASIVGNLLASVAFSALSQALMGQQEKPAPSGIKTRTATAGDSTPQTLIFGTYATAGNHVCPPMTGGRASGAPNGFLTYVMDVSDAPVGGLAGLWINDEKVTLGPPDPMGSLYPGHRPVTEGQYAGQVWIKFFDGTQTTSAMSDLSGAGGNTVERPWAGDMIGRGVAYAIVRFRYNDEVFRGMPTVLFEVNGIGFYDPRKDSTVGGSGAHRWGIRSTYEPSENPAVQVYNILRGITLEDGTRWGGEAEAADLPLANWFAAMNECDLTVGGEPQYRTSTEVRVGPEQFGGHEPAAVIEELLRCCSGQISEYGGVWKMRAGPVGMPVAVLTDEDIIISEEQRYEPFPGLQETYNAVHAQYPEPAEKWVSKEAPPRYNAAWEAQDNGRRLVASLALGACPYHKQVQRLMRAYAEDERHHRRHVITLPPDYAALEPLDAVAWSSDRNGYSAKVFEVGAAPVGARSLQTRTSLRERDPADYGWQPGYELPTTLTPVTTPPIAPQAVPGWSVTPTTVKDANGIDRRPAVLLGWEPDQPDVRGVAYEVRVVGQTELAAQGSTQDVRAGGIIVVDGIIPGASMEARGRLVAPRRTLWTSWTPFTVPDVRLDWIDFEQGIRDTIDAAEAEAQAAAQAAQDAQDAVSTLAGYVDDEVAEVRGEIAFEVADLEALAANNLMLAQTHADTQVATEAVERQNATDALALQLQIITANITSENLFTNPLFFDGLNGWSGVFRTLAAKDEQSLDPIVASAPAGNFVWLATRPSAQSNLYQQPTIEWSDGEQFRWRFSAASPVVRSGSGRLRIAWFDANGAVISPPGDAHIPLDFPVANEWKTFSGTETPPVGAVSVYVGVQILGTSAYTTPIAVADLSLRKVDPSVTAKLAELEAAIASEESARTLWQNTAIGRFEDAEGAITQEGMTRANADSALSGRIDITAATLDRGESVINDQYLNTWGSGGWQRWNGQGELTRTPSAVHPAGTDWKFTVTAEQRDGMRILDSPAAIWPGQIGADGYVVEIEYTLASGSLDGAGVELVWRVGATPRFVRLHLADMAAGTNIAGRTSIARAVIVKPADAIGEVTSNTLAVFANYAQLGLMSAKTITFHKVRIRVATDEEMGRGVAAAEIIAAVKEEVYTKVEADQAIATSTTTLKASMEGPGGSVKAAQDAAQAASNLAGSKGKVLVQSTAPSPAERLPQNLWIDTTGGANTPKRWNGSAWVAVTDKIATDAANAAAAAQQTANSLVASVTQSATVLADLEGSVAMVTSEVIAGKQRSFIRQAAWDGQGNVAPGSTIEFDAQHILMRGSVGMEQLVVSGAPNLIDNPRFVDGLNGWSTLLNAQTTMGLRAAGEAWAHPGAPTLMLRQIGTLSGITNARWQPKMGATGPALPGHPCKPGQWYGLSAYLSAHRCQVRVRVYFLRADGTVAGGSASAWTTDTGPNTDPDAWPRHWLKVQAPADAAYIRMDLEKSGTTSGSDSFLFAWKPQIEETHADAQGPSVFNAGGATLVGPDSIYTDAILSRHVSTETIKAINGRFVSLAAANISVGNAEIDSAHIKNLSVDTIKIADGALTSTWSTTLSGSLGNNSGFHTLQVLSFTPYSTSSRLLLGFSCVLTGTDPVTPPTWRLLLNGVNIRQGSGIRATQIQGGPLSFVSIDAAVILAKLPAAGVNTLTFQIGQRTTISDGSLFVWESKK